MSLYNNEAVPFHRAREIKKREISTDFPFSESRFLFD